MLQRIFGSSKRGDRLWDAMSSISRMIQNIRQRGGSVSTRRQAGVIFKPDDQNPFLRQLSANLNQILYEGEGATKTGFEIQDDDHGMKWIILDDGNFDDLLSSVYTVANAIRSNGAAENLLAAVFNSDFAGRIINTDNAPGTQFIHSYLIFRFDRNSYYPFIPTSDKEGERDRDREQEIGVAVRNHGLAVDGSMQQWLGIWGIPF